MAIHIDKVQEYGLTEYEARAYLALIELEDASAREVAEVSRVPRTKIYGVLEDLHKKNLVDVIPERPKRFQPIPFDDYLDGFEAKFQERLAQVKKDKEAFSKLFEVMPGASTEGPGQFRSVKGRKNMLNRFMELLDEAETSVWLLGSGHIPLRLNYFSPMMHEKVTEGIDVRVQCPIEPQNLLDVQETMAFASVRDRPNDPGATSILVIDGSQMLITHYIPDDTHLFKGEDVGLWTNDPAIVRDVASMMGTLWQMGVEAADLIEDGRDGPTLARAEAPRS